MQTIQKRSLEQKEETETWCFQVSAYFPEIKTNTQPLLLLFLHIRTQLKSLNHLVHTRFLKINATTGNHFYFNCFIKTQPDNENLKISNNSKACSAPLTWVYLFLYDVSVWHSAVEEFHDLHEPIQALAARQLTPQWHTSNVQMDKASDYVPDQKKIWSDYIHSGKVGYTHVVPAHENYGPKQPKSNINMEIYKWLNKKIYMPINHTKY